MSLDLLPASASAFERAQSAASARLLGLPVSAIFSARQAASCAPAYLPFLAWERSVHYWSPSDNAGNRARIQSAFNDHLNYGSPVALAAEIALDTGLRITISEWWQARLAWPYFAVNVVVAPGDPAPDLGAAWQSALKRKNVRDMPALRLMLDQPPAKISVCAACNVTSRIFIPSAVRPAPAFLVAATKRAIVAVSIGPFSPTPGPLLDFSAPANSQYLPLLAFGLRIAV